MVSFQKKKSDRIGTQVAKKQSIFENDKSLFADSRNRSKEGSRAVSFQNTFKEKNSQMVTTWKGTNDSDQHRAKTIIGMN